MKYFCSLILFIFCLFVFVSCKSVDNVLLNNPSSSGIYFETAILPVKGVVVLAHGLNTKPSMMGDDKTDGTFAKLFLDAGYHVYRITLPGHSGTIEEMKNVKSQDWHNSAYSQYCEAAEISLANNIPIYLAAFSLGALVYENLMNKEKDVVFNGAILLAPAIAIKKTSRNAVLAANIFASNSKIIKSKAPAEYRAQNGVSVSAYKALFELEDDLHKNEFANCNIPTLIFIDPKDELINNKKLQKHITNFKLTNWNIITVSNKGTEIKPKYHHLIIDNRSLPPAAWDTMSKNILEFLREL